MVLLLSTEMLSESSPAPANRAATHSQGSHNGVVTTSCSNSATGQTAIERQRVVTLSKRNAVGIGGRTEDD